METIFYNENNPIEPIFYGSKRLVVNDKSYILWFESYKLMCVEEERMSDFKSGEQIAYIPSHADRDINHPDVELGFVMYTVEDTVFCRYWSKYSKGELRTKANSEGAPREMIVRHVSHSQEEVDAMIRKIDAENELAAVEYEDEDWEVDYYERSV